MLYPMHRGWNPIDRDCLNQNKIIWVPTNEFLQVIFFVSRPVDCCPLWVNWIVSWTGVEFCDNINLKAIVVNPLAILYILILISSKFWFSTIFLTRENYFRHYLDLWDKKVETETYGQYSNCYRFNSCCWDIGDEFLCIYLHIMTKKASFSSW